VRGTDISNGRSFYVEQNGNQRSRFPTGHSTEPFANPRPEISHSLLYMSRHYHLSVVKTRSLSTAFNGHPRSAPHSQPEPLGRPKVRPIFVREIVRPTPIIYSGTGCEPTTERREQLNNAPDRLFFGTR
jgi:hypothetical protein